MVARTLRVRPDVCACTDKRFDGSSSLVDHLEDLEPTMSINLYLNYFTLEEQVKLSVGIPGIKKCLRGHRCNFDAHHLRTGNKD